MSRPATKLMPTASPSAPLHRLGQLAHEAVGVDGVLDLFVGDRRGVDGDDRLVGRRCARQPAQHLGVEDDVAVHPQHATVVGGAQRLEQAPVGVGLVVVLVVDEDRVRGGLHDELELEADDDRDPGRSAEHRRRCSPAAGPGCCGRRPAGSAAWGRAGRAGCPCRRPGWSPGPAPCLGPDRRHSSSPRVCRSSRECGVQRLVRAARRTRDPVRHRDNFRRAAR